MEMFLMFHFYFLVTMEVNMGMTSESANVHQNITLSKYTP